MTRRRRRTSDYFAAKYYYSFGISFPASSNTSNNHEFKLSSDVGGGYHNHWDQVKMTGIKIKIVNAANISYSPSRQPSLAVCFNGSMDSKPENWQQVLSRQRATMVPLLTQYNRYHRIPKVDFGSGISDPAGWAATKDGVFDKEWASMSVATDGSIGEQTQFICFVTVYVKYRHRK